MKAKFSNRVEEQMRTAYLEAAKRIIDSEERAYQGVRSDYAAMLTKYEDATKQELIRSTWLHYIKKAMCVIDEIYDNQKTYIKSDSKRFCQASSSSKTSSKCKKKRERIEVGNVETGTNKRKCIEKASMSKEATYNIAKSVETDGCVSTDDDRNRSECGDGDGYGSIGGGNSIPGGERPQQMSHPFRTSTPKSSATFRQREDVVVKQQEHIGRAQSDQSSEHDLYRIATNGNTIYKKYPVVKMVNTDASVTAAMTGATNLSSSAVPLPLSPKPSSRVNDDNRSRDSRTANVSCSMRADVQMLFT